MIRVVINLGFGFLLTMTLYYLVYKRLRGTRLSILLPVILWGLGIIAWNLWVAPLYASLPWP